MNPELLGIVMLVALLAVIFVGFPISFTLIVVAIVFGYKIGRASCRERV